MAVDECIQEVRIHRRPRHLDADIAKYFDRIEQQALDKVNASPFVRRQIKAWLKAGVMDGEKLFPTE